GQRVLDGRFRFLEGDPRPLPPEHSICSAQQTSRLTCSLTPPNKQKPHEPIQRCPLSADHPAPHEQGRFASIEVSSWREHPSISPSGRNRDFWGGVVIRPPLPGRAYD